MQTDGPRCVISPGAALIRLRSPYLSRFDGDFPSFVLFWHYKDVKVDGLARLLLNCFLRLFLVVAICSLVPAFLVGGTSALAAQPAIDSGSLTHVDLGAVAEFSVQPYAATFDEAEHFSFQTLGHRSTLDSQGNALWLRFSLVNQDGVKPVRWVLHHQSSQLDEMTMWTREGGGEWHQSSVSDREPFHLRTIAYRKPALDHVTPPGTTTEVLVRLALHTDGQLATTTHLWEWTRFDAYVQLELLLNGVYYGVMFTLIFLSLLFAVALRDDSFLYYSVFVFATALLWGVHSGLAHQYLWPSQVWLHNESYHQAFLLFAISALQLAKSFLRTKRHLKVLHWALTLAQVIALLGIFSRLAGFHWPPISLYNFFNMVVLSMLPLAAWVAYRRGAERVMWFALGWVIYALGLALASILSSPQWFASVITYNYFQVVSLIQALVLSLAMAERLLHLDRDRQKAIELAHQDPLTGLGNRRLLVQQYDAMRHRFHQDGMPVYLILFDIDHFKIINDRYGHDAGDLVIAELAALLRRFSRASDVCVRLGGEEFALLLNADNDAVPWQIAERIRTQFAARPTHYGDEVIAHTLSAGIARMMTEEAEQGFRVMLASADEALYQAKASGRNCTLFARAH